LPDATDAPVHAVRLEDVSMAYGNVVALRNVDFAVGRNEIVGLVGDNGAGKSTLIKILSGVHQPDKGELTVAGQPTRLADPHQARELGIATVFQNLALVDLRDVAANIFLGREPVKWRWFIDTPAMLREARKVLADLRVRIPSLSVEVAVGHVTRLNKTPLDGC